MEEVSHVAFSPIGFADEELCTSEYMEERVKFMAANNDYFVYVGDSGVVRCISSDFSTRGQEKDIATVENPIGLKATKHYVAVQMESSFKVFTFTSLEVFDSALNQYHHGTFTLHERNNRPFVSFQEVGDTNKLTLMARMAKGIEKHHHFLQYNCKIVSASSHRNTLALSSADGCKIHVYRDGGLSVTLSKSKTKSDIYDMVFTGDTEYLVVSSSSSTIHIFSLAREESLLGNIAEYAVGRKSIVTCTLPAGIGPTKCYLHVVSATEFYVVVAGPRKFMVYVRDDPETTVCTLLLESKYFDGTDVKPDRPEDFVYVSAGPIS